jgi:hypothetical protein
MVILLVYVDDIATAAKEMLQLQCFFETLSTRFNTKIMEVIEKIPAARITHDRRNRILYINQEQNLTTVLNRFRITEEKNIANTILTTDFELLCPGDE